MYFTIITKSQFLFAILATAKWYLAKTLNSDDDMGMHEGKG